MKNTVQLTILLLSSLALSSCGKEIKPDSTSLVNTHWRLISINGVPANIKPEATLKFDSKKASGFSGCNRYFSKYSTNQNSVSFQNIGSTKMLCSNQSSINMESQLLTSLHAAKSFYINSKKQLLIQSSSGSLLFNSTN